MDSSVMSLMDHIYKSYLIFLWFHQIVSWTLETPSWRYFLTHILLLSFLHCFINHVLELVRNKGVYYSHGNDLNVTDVYDKFSIGLLVVFKFRKIFINTAMLSGFVQNLVHCESFNLQHISHHNISLLQCLNFVKVRIFTLFFPTITSCTKSELACVWGGR